MKVAVLTRPKDPCSLRIYHDKLVDQLSTMGLQTVSFTETEDIPTACDLVWDPGLCMRRISPILQTSSVPVVGTMHGVNVFSLEVDELSTDPYERQELLRLKESLTKDWTWFREKIAAVVAVSEYAAAEVRGAFGLQTNTVHVVPNGHDPDVFCPNSVDGTERRSFFFHVSNGQPIKNLQRLFLAYSSLPRLSRPELVAVIPGFDQTVTISGIRVIDREVSQADLSVLYRAALALVFPSLRETFGLPIIEAMACGCPVITSDSTGCLETARDAALLVDPRSVLNIASTMERLFKDESLRNVLIERGLRRARSFTWRASAERLLDVFNLTLDRVEGKQLE